jgi:hypothetical protein
MRELQCGGECLRNLKKANGMLQARKDYVAWKIEMAVKALG